MRRHPWTSQGHALHGLPPRPQPRRSARTASGLAALAAVLLAVAATPTAVSIAAEQAFASAGADPNTWPDACQVLTDAEIKSFIPDATKIVRKGQRGGLAGGGETKQFVKCKFETPRSADTYPDTSPSYVTFWLTDVGDPGEIAQTYQRQRDQRKALDRYQDYGTRFGADGCQTDGTSSTMTCHASKFRFTMIGNDAGITEGGEVQYRQNREWTEGPLGSAVRIISAKMR